MTFLWDGVSEKERRAILHAFQKKPGRAVKEGHKVVYLVGNLRAHFKASDPKDLSPLTLEFFLNKRQVSRI
jgi:hypothetical protein